jgi:hypothetical protein
MNAHHWIQGLKAFRFAFCAKCGLVALRNEASQKAVRKACKGEES